jgi:phospholipid transport system transporter-binding protein
MDPAARSARIEAGASGLTVHGALTFRTARRTCEAGLEALKGSTGDVTLDLAGVEAADSAGLAVLIEWLRWAHLSRRRLTLSRLPAAITGLARLSELDSLLQSAG